MIIKGNEFEKCWNCGELTYNVSVSFETAMCSEECDNQKWKEYEEDLKKLTKKDEMDNFQ